MQPIGAIQGATTEEIQALLRGFARRLVPARIAGVLEEDDALVSLTDGRVLPLYQDLGAGASGCALDPAGLVLAGEAVRQEIAAGCDLVVLSKFGKLEAESGSGLVAAFVAAIEAGVPVLTSVAPKYREAWAAFAAPFYEVLVPDVASLDAWWRAVAPNPRLVPAKQS